MSPGRIITVTPGCRLVLLDKFSARSGSVHTVHIIGLLSDGLSSMLRLENITRVRLFRSDANTPPIRMSSKGRGPMRRDVVLDSTPAAGLGLVAQRLSVRMGKQLTPTNGRELLRPSPPGQTGCDRTSE